MNAVLPPRNGPRVRDLLALIVALAVAAAPAGAQAPTTSAAPPAAATAPADSDEPSLGERRLVAYVATGVAVASLATGVTFGILAQRDFACVSDVIACNKTLGAKDKIVGDKLFEARAQVEQKALIADMAYLFAAASAVVATVGFLRGFVFLDEADEQSEAATEASSDASSSPPTTTAPAGGGP